MSDPPRVGVVGHVEWVEFAVVGRVPAAGEIVHAREAFATAAGGGAVAAVQLRKLAGAATFLTALGRDALGAAAGAELSEVHGVDLHVAWRDTPQRCAFTFLDDAAERTITVMGERIVPHAADPLPWEACAELDGIYFTAGDAAALRAARAARVLVGTPRARDAIAEAGVELDVLVASDTDAGERVDAAALSPRSRQVVLTRGAHGGRWEGVDGSTGTWASAEPPGPPVDAYGCGDSFAAGLTYGLAAGMPFADAIALAARCGATCLAGRGPYGRQLELSARASAS